MVVNVGRRDMSIRWSDFVLQVQDELSTGRRGYLILDEALAKERDLTKAIVSGLRRLFKESYPGSDSPKTKIHHHVTKAMTPKTTGRGRPRCATNGYLCMA